MAILSGCGDPGEKPGKLIPVTLRLQWHTQCQFAGYYTALEEGFYRDQGLKVSIKEGGYGKNPMETVAFGQEEFGTKWPADIMASDKPLTALANILKGNGLRLVSRRDSGIAAPPDLEGKTISIWFIGNETQLFALLENHGINPQTEVEIVPQRWDLSQFLNREVDAFSVMNYNELLRLYEKGFPPEELSVLSYRDYGLDFPGHSVFTSREFAAANPDICRRFVRASLQGWDYAARHPEKAVDHVLAHDTNELLSRDLQEKQLERILDLIHREEYPFGKSIPSQHHHIAEIYKKYGLMPEDVDPEGFYTNEYLPTDF